MEFLDECNKVKPNFWFTTMGGKIFGRDGGITPSKFSLSKVLEQGEESVEKKSLFLRFEKSILPRRNPSQNRHLIHHIFGCQICFLIASTALAQMM